ncbi:hypothetical protein KST83_08815 [Fusobacterium nucleatum]|uniref:Uncharacterized protein n=1 Tax=Fusobacterium nucleatum subsp. polymorphum TaxID=76857 RepID=A0A2C6ARS5_FUSNP|nr:hypothetical protein [Fusobacterium polymorphum]PHH96925.1 hypothetical protein CA840_06130 [Fusobacterium polymorphum]
MEEFQTKQKSNFFMGLICLIAGALATCVLYFGISRLGYFRVVCQIVLIKKFRLTINRTKRIFLRIKI